MATGDFEEDALYVTEAVHQARAAELVAGLERDLKDYYWSGGRFDPLSPRPFSLAEPAYMALREVDHFFLNMGWPLDPEDFSRTAKDMIGRNRAEPDVVYAASTLPFSPRAAQ